MTKKHLLPTVASVTICSLALCNCSTISSYRKDPSEWNQPAAAKPKVEKVSKKSETKSKSKKKKGGFFSFFSKYRQSPEKWNKTDAKPEATKVIAATPIPTRASRNLPRVTAPSTQPRYVKQPRVENQAALQTEKIARTGAKKQRRKVGGLLNPDADKLPTKKDLQEIQSTVPKSGNSNGVNIPVKP